MMILGWNAALAKRFPDADHSGCVQKRDDDCRPYTPARCLDYHCVVCGKRSSVLGRHDCEPR